MAKTKKTPTNAQFEAFEAAYQYFNEVLFAYELPDVILNLSRKSKAMGFAAPNRWVRTPTVTSSNVEESIDLSTLSEADGNEKPMHELSINPEILCLSLIEVYSTLVHEQCHIWQFHCGKPSRRTYHNKEWAEKMLEVGLTPSSTGYPGGKMTGQRMNDYPTANGVFLEALDKMPDAFKMPFISIEGLAKATAAGDGSATEPKPKNKVKYSCPSCTANIWGKPDLNVVCGDCEVMFESA